MDRLKEKASKLLESGRVEPLSEGVFNIIGEHGTYTVAKDYTGKVSCDCPGFLTKGRCSHATAVIMLTEPKRRNRRRARGF